MIKDDEVGSEGFALLTDCARDDVLQRQVSVIDEKSVISRKQDEEEGSKEGIIYLMLNLMLSPGRPQGARCGASQQT